MNRSQLGVLLGVLSGVLIGPITMHHIGATPVEQMSLGIQMMIVTTSLSIAAAIYVMQGI